MNGTAGERAATLRMIAAAALVTLPVLAIVWSVVAWWSILPAELPSQWSRDKVVSHLPTLAFAISALVIAATSAAFSWHAALSPMSYDHHRRTFLISGSVAATATAAWLISGGLASHPDQGIGANGFWAIAALFYGLAPFAVAPANSSSDSVSEGVDLELTPSESVAWSHSQSVPLFVCTSVVCLLAAGGFGFVPMMLAGVDASNVGAAIVMSVLALTSYAFARIRVTVDRRGLHARSATLGITLVSVALADVAAAETIILEPLRWGGWGYRAGLHGRALVLRSGPAIVVTLRNGTDVAVTTASAEQAVSVLRALLLRGAD
ncbi:hypothetical protein ACFQ9V_03410 [Leifsonia sp. NPDC056665]|uniref:hypothetical protein n=1 Tax=Leifsonia sp. NPDC056665 TaxID=3345901 RepID=UPI00368E831F